MAESNDPHVDPNKSGHSYELVSVTNAQQNRLTGWLFSTAGDYGTALVAGGNAQNLSSTYSLSSYLVGNGFRVLVFTYQGFDTNGGSADLKSLVGDARAFYLYATRTYGAEPIAFVGYSTGAVTGLCMGDTEHLAAVVAEGSFNPKTILEDKHLWFASPMSSFFKSSVPDELDTKRCAGKLGATPVLFLHNPNDGLAPYDSARQLFQSDPGPKEFLDTSNAPSADSHLSSASDPRARDRVLQFLKNHLVRSAPQSLKGVGR